MNVSPEIEGKNSKQAYPELPTVDSVLEQFAKKQKINPTLQMSPLEEAVQLTQHVLYVQKDPLARPETLINDALTATNTAVEGFFTGDTYTFEGATIAAMLDEEASKYGALTDPDFNPYFHIDRALTAYSLAQYPAGGSGCGPLIDRIAQLEIRAASQCQQDPALSERHLKNAYYLLNQEIPRINKQAELQPETNQKVDPAKTMEYFLETKRQLRDKRELQVVKEILYTTDPETLTSLLFQLPTLHITPDEATDKLLADRLAYLAQVPEPYGKIAEQILDLRTMRAIGQKLGNPDTLTTQDLNEVRVQSTALVAKYDHVMDADENTLSDTLLDIHFSAGQHMVRSALEMGKRLIGKQVAPDMQTAETHFREARNIIYRMLADTFKIDPNVSVNIKNSFLQSLVDVTTAEAAVVRYPNFVMPLIDGAMKMIDIYNGPPELKSSVAKLKQLYTVTPNPEAEKKARKKKILSDISELSKHLKNSNTSQADRIQITSEIGTNYAALAEFDGKYNLKALEMLDTQEIRQHGSQETRALLGRLKLDKLLAASKKAAKYDPVKITQTLDSVRSLFGREGDDSLAFEKIIIDRITKDVKQSGLTEEAQQLCCYLINRAWNQIEAVAEPVTLRILEGTINSLKRGNTLDANTLDYFMNILDYMMANQDNSVRKKVIEQIIHSTKGESSGKAYTLLNRIYGYIPDPRILEHMNSVSLAAISR